MAKALKDEGFEVIYTGLHQTPEQVVSAALQESVDVIGLSMLSGGQVPLVTRIMQLMKENEMEDVLVTAGGIIPKEDRDILKALGVLKVFGPGSLSKDIAQFLKEAASKRYLKS